MNLNLLVFNIAYYLITFLLYHQARQDASSSLGIGFFALFFWLVAGIVLIILCKRKIIKSEKLADKIGVFTATPALSLVTIQFLASNGSGGGSEWYFDRNNHRYKVITKNYSGSSQPKSIEYYKSVNRIRSDTTFYNIDNWVKDSIWVEFSRGGDTTETVHFKDGKKIN